MGEATKMKDRWNQILHLQDRFYPSWRSNLPRTLYSTALAGEVGELCGIITHLDGGGTNNQKYDNSMILEEAVDSFIQLILLIERSGFNYGDFNNALIHKILVLHKRLEKKEMQQK